MDNILPLIKDKQKTLDTSLCIGITISGLTPYFYFMIAYATLHQYTILNGRSVFKDIS